MPLSRYARGVVLPFAIDTSTCRSSATTSSAVYFRFAIPVPSCPSLSNLSAGTKFPAQATPPTRREGGHQQTHPAQRGAAIIRGQTLSVEFGLAKDIEELRPYLRETRVLLDAASLERAASLSGRNSRHRTNFFLEFALRGANVGALDLIFGQGQSDWQYSGPPARNALELLYICEHPRTGDRK